MALFMLKACLLRKHDRKKPSVTSPGILDNYDAEETGNKICRVCGSMGEIDVYGVYEERSILDDMRVCSGVPIYINDGMPRWICLECHQLLQSAVRFREMCRASATRFVKLIETQPLSASCEPTEIYQPEYEAEDTDYGGGCQEEQCPEVNIPTTLSMDPSAVYKICRYCKIPFDSSTSYKKHAGTCWRLAKTKRLGEGSAKKQTNGSKEHLCETCGKSLSSLHSLISHRTIHQNIFPFKCGLCPYKGKTVGLLRTHRKIHFAEKPYACTQCPRAFRTASNLKKHIQRHNGDAHSIQCDMCDKRLRNMESLKKHQKSHQQNTPVVCAICSKQYRTKKGLSKHKTKVHKMGSGYKGRLPSYMLCQPENDLDQPAMIHLSDDYINT